MIRRTITVLSFLLLGLLIALPATFAGEPADDKQEDQMSFDEEAVTTDYLKPGTLMIEGLRRGRRSSLISIRLDFVAEILKSAEDI